MEFCPFEKAVMELLLAGEERTLEVLRIQMGHASVVSRKLTGAGFFTDMSVAPEAAPVRDLPSFVFGDVEASVSGLQHGAGFLLYIKGGFLSMLEGYCYSEHWPETITSFELRYHSDPIRDLGEVSRAWKLGTKT